jgi:4-amino-4-deoxy-L-arabinose transferase-like glycosyltransferase
MFQRLNHRAAHYAILLAATALLLFPNLGNHSLWDVDEGINAEAAREMWEADSWITPIFNFELRTAKPALLYWLQGTSYSIFGVNEFAARLPSVLAGMLTILLVYELGRGMFGAGAGLLAGIILASALEFCMLAHAATPDATLLLFTVLTFYFFWRSVETGRTGWYIPAGAAAGLAVLTKGPIGLALPGLVVLIYFAWNRELRKVWDRRVLQSLGTFLLVALPWYILVAVETRGVWAAKFLGRENLFRFMQPMENHSGPVIYHALGILVLFAPWSVFLMGALWHGVRSSRTARPDDSTAPAISKETRANRLLLSWFACYLVFFSIAATKLPNYVLPLYPAIAVLTGRFLASWRRAEFRLPRWVMPTAVAALAFVGVVTIVGFLVVGGTIRLPFGKMRLLTGLEDWAFLGLIPMTAAVVAGFALRRDRRDRFLVTCATAAVFFVASIAAFPSMCLDAHKGPKALVEQAQANQPGREIRLAGLYYFQPSLVFYGQREVRKLESLEQTVEFLSLPYPAYLFVPEPMWRKYAPHVPVAYRQIAKQYDFLKNCEVLVVTNQ